MAKLSIATTTCVKLFGQKKERKKERKKTGPQLIKDTGETRPNHTSFSFLFL
jgi:hypothetical protein